jgi:Peptidase MA superfamily
MNLPMRQMTWAQLSNREISFVGSKALEMNPRGWYHAETEDFIIHYRNFSDALQIAREIEFDLWYVAKTLGATKQQYARKSHVYVFQDDKEWQIFVKEVHHRETWSHSFAEHDDLFLNIHGTGMGFESHTLAHETTHAVVARIYGDRHWPLWLNEGFADYMADACGAVRRGLPPGANPRNLRNATMTVTELIAISDYPADRSSVAQLYDTGTKFVHYLFTKYPAQLFPQFVDRLLTGESATAALVNVYGDEFRNLSAFDKRFQASLR